MTVMTLLSMTVLTVGVILIASAPSNNLFLVHIGRRETGPLNVLLLKLTRRRHLIRAFRHAK